MTRSGMASGKAEALDVLHTSTSCVRPGSQDSSDNCSTTASRMEDIMRSYGIAPAPSFQAPISDDWLYSVTAYMPTADLPAKLLALYGDLDLGPNDAGVDACKDWLYDSCAYAVSSKEEGLVGARPHQIRQQ